MKLTKQQISILKKHTEHFSQAKLDYVRGVYARDIDELQPIYEELGYKLGCRHCSVNVIGMMKVLGRAYDEAIKKSNKSNDDKG